MTSLPEAIARLHRFRQSFDDGQICEESGLSTEDLDVILRIYDENDAQVAALNKAMAADGFSVGTRDPGIPVYRLNSEADT